MTRSLTLTTLAALLAAASVHAAEARTPRLATLDAEPAAQTVATRIDGERIRYDDEAQFQRDYGAQAEKLAPGVYLMNAGPFAGKTVSMGIAGLQYDLAALQARARETGLKAAERGELQTRIAELQTLAREHEARQVRQGFTAKARQTTGFGCWTYDYSQNRQVFYTGYAEAIAEGGLYKDRGDGSFNPYYARMYSVAIVNVYPPFGVWGNHWLNASASATNVATGQTLTGTPQYLANSAAAASGTVYSGPNFVHNLSATATATAGGDCWGYLSVSDTFVF